MRVGLSVKKDDAALAPWLKGMACIRCLGFLMDRGTGVVILLQVMQEYLS